MKVRKAFVIRLKDASKLAPEYVLDGMKLAKPVTFVNTVRNLKRINRLDLGKMIPFRHLVFHIREMPNRC